MKLTTIKPRLQPPAQRARVHYSGDDRIRGRALQSIRERILTRDCGICQCERCKASGEVKPATLVDHITPLWMGGKEDDSNRQAINADCHDLKSAEEAKLRAAGG
jgi:5-methylcytosine-specific restriction protein A